MLATERPRGLHALPHSLAASLAEAGIDQGDVVVATDTDLQLDGAYREGWVIVTRDGLLVFSRAPQNGHYDLSKKVALEEVESARTDTRVGSGFLEVKTEGLYEEIARFSNRYTDKFVRLAGRINGLTQGRVIEPALADDESEGRCRKCGTRVPERRMTICPKCIKRGQVFLRFLGRTRNYLPHTVAACVLVVVTILIQLIPAQFQRVLIDNVFLNQPLPVWFAAVTNIFNFHEPMEWLYLLVMALAITTAAGSVVAWARERLSVWINNRMGYDLRREVFERLQELAVRYHDTHPVGQLMTRCSQDVEALQGFINQLTSGFGYQIILVISVAVVMLMTSWQLTLWAVLPAPFVMICTVWFYRRIVPDWQKYWTSRSNLSNALHGSLNGVRVVKAFAQEAREADRFDRYSSRFRDAGYNVGYANAWFYPAMGWVFQFGSYAVWLTGGYALLHGTSLGGDQELTVGTLVLFLSYLAMFYAPLNSLTQMSTWFTSFTTQAHRVFEVLDEDPEVAESEEAVDVEIAGAIAFKNVTFGYDPHIPVIHDISFEIHPGEMVGIVGHSGSGKSTTANLIMRFYDANQGVISVDGTDIRGINKHCLRRQVGLVAQDPFLFRGSIADNVAYGNPDVAPERILDAALAANAHMFITRIHDGYDARLGEHGSGLSGGERQRVAIARALLHDPRILILDEATSSVDAIAEREIQRALEALSAGRTTIAIAHRLSTLRNCDRILVFEEGVIREQGSHLDLMAQNGIYKRLVDIQTQLNAHDTSAQDLAELNKHEIVTGNGNGHANVHGAVKSNGRENGRRVRSAAPQIQYLDPAKLRITTSRTGGMRVEHDGQAYPHVRAYRCFPTSRPSAFIALWIGNSALEHKEIGVVRWLHELDSDSRKAVELELAKRYFIHYIKRINSITEDIGFLTWDVDTDKGRMEFLMKRWERSAVVETPNNGCILLDLDMNRYEIEDLDRLDEESRGKFLDYIYW